MDPAISGKKVFMKLGPVRRALAAACVLPLVLAGCSDAAPTPEIPDPTTSSPSPSADETETGPVEPTLPPEAEGDGVEAAEAFVSHFYASVDYAQATGETEQLRSLSSKSCAACEGGAEIIERVYKQGGAITGGDHEVEAAQVTGTRRVGDAGSLYYLSVRVSRTDQTVTGSKDLDGEYPAATQALRYELFSSKVGWQVSKWYAK
ncbi:DUF6318 family protein [Nocardioides terrigena]|uniref:DUF6318 family protein n=1 Tax=Nocardioides terrigena TaxID=424797 RepID=UPI00131EF7F1|nr:DUF6318 family protein [Nocardioides terrigena]